ncbi:MAG: hypothetical protein HQL17_06200 [Candidatus Omnitrophica bacterium]|nr:hypothetical protein [Candidatus Omnitrophota bacterium]
MLRLLKFLPFVLLIFYWAYLVRATQPLVIYDAIGYQDAGRLLMEQGWGAYFKGLNREPLFPLMISIAMRLEHSVGIGYTYILKTFLLVELALAMTGTYHLARSLGARRLWAGMGAFYLGMSPAILNSTLWLWSEAAIYPFVVWGVIWMIRTWREMKRACRVDRLAGHAALTATLFILAAMVKAPVATVFVALLLPFYAAVVHGFWVKDGRGALRAVFVSAICLLMMGAYVENYKFLNWRGNGHYAITNRADLALFGNTVRRLDPEALKRIPEAVLSVPRLVICERYYGRSCGYWGYATSDNINEQYAQKLAARGFSDIQRQEFFFSTAFRLMREHPFQEAFFSVIEGMKMFFWENRLFFVKYPDWLVRVYSHNVLVLTLCFSGAVLSLIALCRAIFLAVRRRLMPQVFAVLFVGCFIGSYALFFVDIRYGFPLAPVFIAMIAAIGVREHNEKGEWA